MLNLERKMLKDFKVQKDKHNQLRNKCAKILININFQLLIIKGTTKENVKIIVF